jgi:hypothetical protein
MKYQSDTIGTVLSRLNRDIFIPGIQRPYVWEPEQIVKLFDSLMRGDPIKSFLFWELQPGNFEDWDIYQFVRRFRQGDIHNDSATAIANQPVVLVLDGQQRLTSLLIGLLGSYTMRLKNARKSAESSWFEDALYLDLLQRAELGEDADPDEAAVRDTYYGFKFLANEKRPAASKKHLWFRVADIMGITSNGQLSAATEHLLLQHPGIDTDAQDTVRTNLARLFDVIWNEDSICYYMERDQQYEKVLDIFIRANDGGTKLSKSDLLMSMITLRWESLHARNVTEDLVYHLREVLNQEKSFDRDYLLRSGLFFNDLNFAFRISNFTPRNIAIIENTWQPVSQALRMAADIFRRTQITGAHLTASNAVMLVACYLYKRNKGVPPDQWECPAADEERIRKWVVSVLFHGVLGGAANITMELYRKVLNEQLLLSPTFPAQPLIANLTRRGRVMNFGTDAVERFAATEVKGRLGQPALSLLYDRTDWTTATWVAVQVIPSHRLDDDRLLSVGVPIGEVTAFKSWHGRLANSVLLTESECREYHQLDFEDWVTSRSDAWLNQHLLPTNSGLYHERSVLDFVKARSTLISARLSTLFDEPEIDVEAMPVRKVEEVEAASDSVPVEVARPVASAEPEAA